MKKQFITEATRLQKLAGIITESQYRELNENVDYIIDNGTEIDTDNFQAHFYNLLKQAGYNLPEHVIDDIDESFAIDPPQIDDEFPLSYYQNFSLEDAKDMINDIIDASSDDPYYADYESIEDFKGSSSDLDKKYQEKERQTKWEYQYDGDEKVVRSYVYKWDPQYKIYKPFRKASEEEMDAFLKSIKS
jgi:hypothetical protein